MQNVVKLILPIAATACIVVAAASAHVVLTKTNLISKMSEYATGATDKAQQLYKDIVEVNERLDDAKKKKDSNSSDLNRVDCFLLKLNKCPETATKCKDSNKTLDWTKINKENQEIYYLSRKIKGIEEAVGPGGKHLMDVVTYAIGQIPKIRNILPNGQSS